MSTATPSAAAARRDRSHETAPAAANATLARKRAFCRALRPVMRATTVATSSFALTQPSLAVAETQPADADAAAATLTPAEPANTFVVAAAEPATAFVDTAAEHATAFVVAAAAVSTKAVAGSAAATTK
eukprot:360463-Prymnesium_polylepis.1